MRSKLQLFLILLPLDYHIDNAQTTEKKQEHYPNHIAITSIRAFVSR